MTVSNQNAKSGPYTANGVTTTFDRTFRLVDASHIRIEQVLDGFTTNITTGFSQTGVGADTGTVVFAYAPADGAIITITRSIPLEQQSDYTNEGKVPPEVVEADLDGVVMMIQDNAASIAEVAALAQALPGPAAEAAALSAAQAAASAEAAAAQTGLFSGFSSAGSDTWYARHLIPDDEHDREALGGSKVNGFKVDHTFGGAAMTGGRHAIYGVLTQSAAGDPTAFDQNFVGVQGQVISSSGNGGTAPTFVDGRGAYFGMSSIASIDNAPNLLNVTGAEINTRITGTTSVAYKSGMQIVTKDEIQGAVFDCVLAISRTAQVGVVGNKVGILFGNMNGAHPVDTDGALIKHEPGTSLDYVLDLSGVTINQQFLQATDLVLGPDRLGIRGANAVINLGAEDVENTPALNFHSSGNNNDYDCQLIASEGVAVPNTGVLTFNGGQFVFDTPVVSGQADNVTEIGEDDRRFSQVYARQFRPGPASGQPLWSAGPDSPEGNVTAPVGSLWTRTNGGAGTTLYVKESGTGNTGWVAK